LIVGGLAEKENENRSFHGIGRATTCRGRHRRGARTPSGFRRGRIEKLPVVASRGRAPENRLVIRAQWLAAARTNPRPACGCLSTQPSPGVEGGIKFERGSPADSEGTTFRPGVCSEISSSRRRSDSRSRCPVCRSGATRYASCARGNPLYGDAANQDGVLGRYRVPPAQMFPEEVTFHVETSLDIANCHSCLV